MNMKQMIQSILRPFGYRIQDIRKLGRDPWTDVQILLQGASPRVCFDVGAHQGETAREMAKSFPDAAVYSFEPDPDNFAKLRENVKHLPAVKIFPQALGDQSRRARLLKTQFSQSNSLLPASAEVRSEHNKKVGEADIEVTTLDQFCEEQKIGMIDLLKTDCQGYDLRVLRGATQLLSEQRVNVLVCESLFMPEYEGQGWFFEILQFLHTMNYVPVTFGEPMRNAHHEAMWADVVFKRREPEPK
jgi:FkbM family methyltransferase